VFGVVCQKKIPSFCNGSDHWESKPLFLANPGLNLLRKPARSSTRCIDGSHDASEDWGGGFESLSVSKLRCDGGPLTPAGGGKEWGKPGGSGRPKLSGGVLIGPSPVSSSWPRKRS